MEDHTITTGHSKIRINRINMRYLTTWGITLLLSFTNAICIAETHIHITTGFTPPVSDFYNSVLTEIDKRLPDISISFEVLPAERSLVLANQKVNDGECCRIASVVANQYKNLVAINESFFTARFSAFGKSRSAKIKNFEDLKPFSVGTVEGWKIAVDEVKKVKPAEVHIVTTPDQMFRMINQDRLDYGVVGYLSGLETISRLGFDAIKAIEPPLVEIPLYLLLHSEHKNLIPLFDSEIKSMKQDGTIDKLYAKLIKSFE